MIELDFFDPSEDYGVVKATVHKTGKLGFSNGASKKLELDSNVKFKVAANKSPDDKSIYMIKTQENDTSGYKVNKAGEYYYMSIKNIIDSLGYDYTSEAIIFNIQEVEINTQQFYKLIRRGKK